MLEFRSNSPGSRGFLPSMPIPGAGPVGLSPPRGSGLPSEACAPSPGTMGGQATSGPRFTGGTPSGQVGGMPPMAGGQKHDSSGSTSPTNTPGMGDRSISPNQPHGKWMLIVHICS